VDTVIIEIYTPALLKVGTFEGVGRSGKGWLQVPVEAAVFDQLPNGMFYVVAAGMRDGNIGQRSIGKILILR
jgi:hypothetical protein